MGALEKTAIETQQQTSFLARGKKRVDNVTSVRGGGVKVEK